ncbi:cilia- and flagella-associated protein 157-like isoform X2 [Acropora muricata]|uniref:cilia- and flagella-associated protein 157-like isoform X2 n=1 Tax=Acropora muricata TaxID=159855 RepID=UPI0034E50A21
MEEKHRTILRRQWFNIRDNLEPNNILPKLVLVLRETDEEEIREQSTRQERCDKLLYILPTRGENAFNVFVNALVQEAPHLAKKLTEAVTIFENQLIDDRAQSENLIRTIRGESKTEEDEEEKDHRKISKGPKELRSPHETFKTENQELSESIQQHGGHESCSRCEGFRNERDSARRRNQNLEKQIQVLKMESEDYQRAIQALQKNLQLLSQKLEDLKEQQDKIGKLKGKNKELENKAREQRRLRKQAEDCVKKSLEETATKNVELENMSEANKRLNEESNAVRSKCNKLGEEVKRLSEMLEHKKELQESQVVERTTTFQDKATSTRELKWKGIYIHRNDFDRHGVVYAFANKFGGISSSRTRISATRSSDGRGTATIVLENQLRRGVVSATKATENSWWCVDLTENYALYLTHYTLRHGQEYRGSVLRNWRLEGSVDGSKWTVLKNHKNDHGLEKLNSYSIYCKYCTCTRAIDGELDAFRYFRIFQTDDENVTVVDNASLKQGYAGLVTLILEAVKMVSDFSSIRLNIRHSADPVELRPS